MLAKIKLFAGAFVVGLIGLLLALVKIKSSKIENQKVSIKIQKESIAQQDLAIKAVKADSELAKKVVKIHEKVATTTTGDDRNFLRDRNRARRHGDSDKL